MGSPYLLQFNLLTDCIFNCGYCYLSELRKKHEKSLSFDSYKKFIDRFSRYFIDHGIEIRIDLTGGDLWLHKDIEKIVSYTYELPYVSSIGLMINSLWHPGAKNIILKIKDKIASIQLNVDALTNRADDLIWLSKHGIRMSIKIMISKDKNYFRAQLRTLDQLRKKVPNLHVAVDRLCPVSVEQVNEVAPLTETIEMVKEVVKRDPNLFVGEDPLLLAVLRKRGIVKSDELEGDCLTGCAIPSGGLVIFPDGSIKLCARIPSFDTGLNVETFDLFEYIKKYSNLSKKDEKCDSCTLGSSCQGGCPATSFLANGGRFGRDINCLLQ